LRTFEAEQMGKSFTVEYPPGPWPLYGNPNALESALENIAHQGVFRLIARHHQQVVDHAVQPVRFSFDTLQLGSEVLDNAAFEAEQMGKSFPVEYPPGPWPLYGNPPVRFSFDTLQLFALTAAAAQQGGSQLQARKRRAPKSWSVSKLKRTGWTA
jgi:hypothetical protein